MRVLGHDFRFRLKRWYGVLLAVWFIAVAFPILFFLGMAKGASHNQTESYWGMVFDVFAESFGTLLVSPSLTSIIMFIVLWLPLPLMPFGLFERTYTE